MDPWWHVVLFENALKMERYKIMKYAYPAIFTKEESGVYSVYFPDLEGCYTCGDNLADALMMAEDVLAFTLYGYEKESKFIPAPSELKDLFTSDNEFISYISSDTIEYRKINSNKFCIDAY